MLKRAWFVFAVLWALLILWIAEGTAAPEPMSTHLLVIIFGPFFVPRVLRWFFSYVIYGARPRGPAGAGSIPPPLKAYLGAFAVSVSLRSDFTTSMALLACAESDDESAARNTCAPRGE